MFVKFNDKKEIICMLSIYVDDILITGVDNEIEYTVKLLKEIYNVKDVGDADFIIGIKIDKIGNGYLLQQERYLIDVLDKFGLTYCRSSNNICPVKLIDENKSF